MAARAGDCVTNLQDTLQDVTPAVAAFAFFTSYTGQAFLGVSIGLLALFLVHQATLWLSQDPVTAFHNARTATSIFAGVYDSVAVLWNAGLDVAYLAIPLWNSAALYVVQPMVFTSLEVLSLAFASRPYEGVLTEDDLPFEGHRCPTDGSTTAAAKWCGVASGYASLIGFSTSETSFVANSTLVLSTATARRLSKAAGEPLLPMLDLSFLTDILQGLISATITIAAVLSDVFFHVVFEILTLIFKPLYQFAMLLIESVGAAMFSVFNTNGRRRTTDDGVVGTFSDIIKWGVDLIVIMVFEVIIPFFFALLNLVLCILDLFRPGIWGDQLQCIASTCWQSGSDAVADSFHLFSSIPPVGSVVERMVTKLINSFTGRRFGSASSGGFGFPDLLTSDGASAQAQACAACFNCKLPEARLIWLGIALVFGCVFDGVRFEGEVSNHCLADGEYYHTTLCGPRGVATDALSDTQWREAYTGHRGYEERHLQGLAAAFEQLAEDAGGEGASSEATSAAALAKSWFDRDLTLPKEDQSAKFVRQTCETMRSLSDEDQGPDYQFLFREGSLGYISAQMMYEMCKRDHMPTCQIEPGRSAIDLSYEVAVCAKSQPECIRNRDVCLGRCDGTEAGTLLRQDIVTHLSKQELGALPEATMAAGRVNATIRSYIANVYLFDTSSAFKEYAARLRVRGGFTAIDPLYCSNNPEACAVIQHVLEKAPTLVYVVGVGFRHRYSLEPPSPPPPPAPPPRLTTYGTTSPSPPPPSPPPPPPWFSGSETCVPVITAAEAGLQDTIDIIHERALCIYVRAIVDERIDARRCFSAASFAPSPPPPPDTTAAIRAMIDTILKHKAVQNGESSGQQGDPELTSEEAYAKEQAAAIQGTVDLVERLASENFELRDVLAGLQDKIYAGRRLFENSARSHSLTENALQLDAFGGGPILGLDQTECSALCTALGNSTSQHGCKGYATRYLNPEDPADLSVAACWLLKGLGSCEPIDWAAAVYSRRDTNVCDLPTAYQNPLCITLAPDVGAPLKVLSFAMAATTCRNGRAHNGVRPELPKAYSSLEAMSHLSYARERGITAFWAWTPRSDSETFTHWAGLDGVAFSVPAGDTRCILVANQANDPYSSESMYASMHPCEMRAADGVICESSQAFPPPPPDATAPPTSPPPPPPPPMGVTAALRYFTETVVKPRTELICLAGAMASDLEAICMEMASALTTSGPIGALPSVTPLCEPGLCWHSCGGVDSTDTDGFDACDTPSCADTNCLSFLKQECDSHIHDALDRLYEAACGLASPSPPSPPVSPPSGVLPPPAPPPSPPGNSFLREADEERSNDPDCEPVTYAECLAMTEQMSEGDSSVSNVVSISTAVCSGENEDFNLGISCFEGCALGSTDKVAAQYTFVREGSDRTYMTRRCVDNLLHPKCLCRAAPSPPPPSPAFEVAVWAGTASEHSAIGQPSGYYEHVISGSTLIDAWASAERLQYGCPATDPGAAQCARHCADALGTNAKAFTVHGKASPPSPPPPHFPPFPPLPPPSPTLPQAIFNGANDGCRKSGIIGSNVDFCTDSGPGAVSVNGQFGCDYGSQVCSTAPGGSRPVFTPLSFPRSPSAATGPM